MVYHDDSRRFLLGENDQAFGDRSIGGGKGFRLSLGAVTVEKGRDVRGPGAGARNLVVLANLDWRPRRNGNASATARRDSRGSFHPTTIGESIGTC
jgi:hypothetical protein